MLGTGQFGKVQRGFMDSPHGEKAVAVKKLKEGASQTEKVTFLQEAFVMKQFLHPNILRLVGVVTMSEPVSGWWVAVGQSHSELHRVTLCIFTPTTKLSYLRHSH